MCSVKFRGLIFIFIVFISSVCFAEDRIVLDLKGCIERVVRFHPELGEFKQDVEIYKAKLTEAQAAVFPQIELMALGGPSPKAEKEAISPEIRTDVKSTTINGIFGMLTMQVLQPIYTFGKLSGYKTAAEGGIKVSEAELEKKRSEIILKTKELYWSLSLIRELRNLANEIKDELEKAIKRTEEDLKKDIPPADELTLYKLKTYFGEVKRNLNEIDKNEAIIIEALRFMAGLSGKRIEIITEPLKYEESYMKPDELIAKAFILRPEMIQIREGLKARQSLIDVEKSNLYPQIFFLVKGSLAGATNRDRIHNPYIYDPLNDSMLAAVLGMKLNIDFGITKGKIREAEIEYQKIVEKKKLAENGIPVQIMKAYIELQEASKSAKDMEEAYQNAKKWLVTADANIDMGIGETKDLADAVLAYATTRINHLKALYNQKMALANLVQASGLDKDEREVK
ncbi:TolC family protein [Thermodesulfovibrio yellowstonii]|uniref:Outer membrane efflux protein, putative n=1 Tax=Thermodesulfovibrio yellowstonii (strain ATCC 51303 / DSM 11347 / YP87) TaxID=289376 RepID=B5YKF4_THEYD|nr:TolC family protein [Thermodesulfovibrio yellowstonii]ACI20184.1 outer membrane efflux protein, putative [Thermodesulfovibrio yellowstonii DSM 11347]MDI6865733.1 TolC family protein [Thermodesulfovibrio yellowstonii]